MDSGIKTGILTKAEASGLNKWRRNQNGGETNLNINIASLSSGMYIYKIVAGDKVKSIQFIKQ